MFLLLQGVQFSCEVWVVLFVYSIFATNVRDLQSKFPVRYYDFLGTWFPGSPGLSHPAAYQASFYEVMKSILLPEYWYGIRVRGFVVANGKCNKTVDFWFLKLCHRNFSIKSLSLFNKKLEWKILKNCKLKIEEYQWQSFENQKSELTVLLHFTLATT